MKKFLCVFLSVVLLFSFVACGKNENPGNNDNNNETVSGNENNSSNNNATDNGKITVDKVKNAPETSADDFETEEVNGGVALSGYIGDSEIVVIPKKINGSPVVTVGENCFINNTTIKGVRIADSVVTIETNAFLNCPALEVFICGKNVESIGNYALSYCESLSAVELNDGIKSLGESCFVATYTLKELYMPASLTDINIPFLATETEVNIIAEAGSAAEAYAKEYEIKYEIK